MKIIVADGSMVLRERLVNVLSELTGVKMVEQAQDAKGALEAICKVKPDVVILDTQMRGANGLEVLKHIKRDLPFTILMILTDQSYQQYRRKCLESGADFFFSKTTELKLLVTVVKDLAMNFEGYGR